MCGGERRGHWSAATQRVVASAQNQTETESGREVGASCCLPHTSISWPPPLSAGLSCRDRNKTCTRESEGRASRRGVL